MSAKNRNFESFTIIYYQDRLRKVFLVNFLHKMSLLKKYIAVNASLLSSLKSILQYIKLIYIDLHEKGANNVPRYPSWLKNKPKDTTKF